MTARATRIGTASPEVNLAAKRACGRAIATRAAITAALAGATMPRSIAADIADVCEAAGLSVHRGRHAVTVDAGAVDVAAAWRAAPVYLRRRHAELHGLAVASLETAAGRREARRTRERERAAREAEDAAVADVEL